MDLCVKNQKAGTLRSGFLILILLRRRYDAFLFLDDHSTRDAVSTGFLFHEAIMFRNTFGWGLGFGLDGCSCFHLYYSFYVFIL